MKNTSNPPATRGRALPALTLALLSAGVLTRAHAQLQTAGEVFVNIDATQQAVGALPSLANSGTLAGFFVGTGGGATIPKVALIGGTKGIQFDGTSYMQLASDAAGATLTLPPAGIVGLDPTVSIEVWALNPDAASEETMVSWGKRGGPDGSNVSFGYGTSFQFGAVGHWGSPDLGWNNDGGAPAVNKWHHLVYTYDGTTTRVYADGKIANAEILGSGVIDTATDTSINLATQLDSDGTTPTGGLRGTLSLARVRIHDGVLTDSQIAANYNLEKADFIDPVPATPLQPDRLGKGPIHRYSFSEAVAADAQGMVIKDSVGTADGVVQGAGTSYSGTRLVLSGGASTTQGYGDLPNGLISANGAANGGTGEVTFETWFKITGSHTWSRVFDFGDSGGPDEVTGPGGGGTGLDYIEYSAQIGDDVNSRRFEARDEDPGGGGTTTADVGTTTFNQDAHVVMTWKESTGALSIYENGKRLGGFTKTNPTTGNPTLMSDINDVNVWLGRSNWSADNNLQGEYDEARFYDYVLTPAQILGNKLAGPDVINNTGIAVTVTTPPASLSIPVTYPATFNVVAKGSSPITFQWLRNGAPISGATASSYTVSAVTAADAGAQFAVTVSNTVGGTPTTITTPAATLTVASDPVSMKHRYSFSDAAGGLKAKDSVGTADGDLTGGARIVAGNLVLDGVDSYLNLPNGLVSSLGDNGTFEFWFSYDGGPVWSRVFDFGTKADGEDGVGDGVDFIFYTPKNGDGIPRFDANFPDGGDTTTLSQPGSTPLGTEYAVTLTYSFTGNTARLYTNGVLVATGGVSKPLSALTDDNNVWLGRSQFQGDPYFAGKIDEFRFYSGAMTPTDVATSFAAGPDASAVGPTPTLTIVRDGDTVVVTWPVGSGGYRLEGSPTLGAGAVWTDLGDGTPPSGGNFRVVVPISGTALFMRARH